MTELADEFPVELDESPPTLVPWRVHLSTGDTLTVLLPADWEPGCQHGAVLSGSPPELDFTPGPYWTTAAGFLLLNGSWVSLAHIVRVVRP